MPFAVSSAVPPAVSSWLRIRPAGAPERILGLGETRSWRVGRRPDLELMLPFPAVSSLHATIERTAAGFVLADAGSTNGTFLEGRRLAPGERAPWPRGAVAKVADVDLVLEDERTGPRAGAVESTGTIARRLVADLFSVMNRERVPRLSAVAGPGRGASLALAQIDRVYFIGRGEAADLMLADADISREHARVVRRWDGTRLVDTGSKNGIEVSGLRVLGERALHDGDEIVLGGTSLRFDDPEDRYLTDLAAAPVAMIMAPTVPVSPIEGGLPPPPAPAERPAGISGPVTPVLPLVVTMPDSPVSAARDGLPQGRVLPLAALAAGVLAAVAALGAWLFFG